MKDLVTFPRRRPQDRQCGTRQRLRHSRHHRRYSLRTARPAFRMDHRADPDKVEVAVAALFPARSGPSCAATSPGTAAGAAMHGTRRAAPARLLAGAPRSGRRDRPDQSRQAGSGAAGMMSGRGRLMPAVAALVPVSAGRTGSPGPTQSATPVEAPTEVLRTPEVNSRSCGYEEGCGDCRLPTVRPRCRGRAVRTA